MTTQHTPGIDTGAIARWVEYGIDPGDFLVAVLRNDLRAACERADDNNRTLLFEYVSYLYNYAPSACWGSREKVEAWLGTKVAKAGRP